MTAARVCGIGDEAAASLTGQIAVHRDLGLTGLEVRTVGGKGLHELTEAEFAAAAAELDASGLAVPAVDTPIGSWAVTVGSDFAAECRILATAAARSLALGCDRLRVMSYPGDGRDEADWRREALRRVRELTVRAADSGVTLLHENCQGWGGRSARHTLELLEAAPGLRLVFDIGNGLAYGYEATAFLAAVIDHVDHVHVKDGETVGGEAVFGPPGDGEVDLHGCLDLLDRAGYDGWLSLEPHVAHIPHLRASGAPEDLERGYRACALAFLDLLAERKEGGRG
ncbi:MAG TPA: sugar phosphate isomerase/epimerase family protein [Glycomyces sp.]|nr:sugar phosphate isomerase/epimerase family protein [Glycomyces sp.]